MQHLDIYNFENHDTLLLASGPFTLPWDTAADTALQGLYANGSDTALDQGEGAPGDVMGAQAVEPRMLQQRQARLRAYYVPPVAGNNTASGSNAPRSQLADALEKVLASRKRDAEKAFAVVKAVKNLAPLAKMPDPLPEITNALSSLAQKMGQYGSGEHAARPLFDGTSEMYMVVSGIVLKGTPEVRFKFQVNGAVKYAKMTAEDYERSARDAVSLAARHASQAARVEDAIATPSTEYAPGA